MTLESCLKRKNKRSVQHCIDSVLEIFVDVMTETSMCGYVMVCICVHVHVGVNVSCLCIWVCDCVYIGKFACKCVHGQECLCVY